MMIRKIGYYCRKVLPTVLDDALSYYEQLCKVVLTCNECVNAVNGVVRDVETLDGRVGKTEGDLENLRGSVDDLDRGLKIVDETTTRITSLAENALPKTRSTNALYGTDATGEQKDYTVTNGPNGFTVGLRDAGGVMRVGTPVDDYDAVNLKYFRENMGGSTAEMVLKKVRISAPSGSSVVSIDKYSLNGIVPNTPIWVFYHMPNGEFYGPPGYALLIGGVDVTTKKFADYPNGVSANVFIGSIPFTFKVFFDGSYFYMPYAEGTHDSTVAYGETVDVNAQGATVTSIAYADVVYFKEG